MKPDFHLNFRPLFALAWILALVMLLLIPLQIVVFVIAPPPDTVTGFFDLFQQHPFLGLLSLDFIYLFNNAILVIIYLAIAALLFREKPVPVLLALVLGLIGIACYYPSNPAFEMLTLSTLYAQALPPDQSLYLAAGEAVMAGYTGTAFNTYYVFNAIGLLLFATTFLRSPGFKKSIGYWGLASGGLMIVPSSAGLVGMIFSLLSLIPWVVFIALLIGVLKKAAAEPAV